MSDIGSSSWLGDDFFTAYEAQDGDGMIEMMAQEIAERARDAGLTSVDGLDIHPGLQTGSLPIDIDRVASRANEILNPN